MVVINLNLFIKVSMCTGNTIFLNSLCLEVTWHITRTNIKLKCKLLNFQCITDVKHFYQ